MGVFPGRQNEQMQKSMNVHVWAMRQTICALGNASTYMQQVGFISKRDNVKQILYYSLSIKACLKKREKKLDLPIEKGKNELVMSRCCGSFCRCEIGRWLTSTFRRGNRIFYFGACIARLAKSDLASDNVTFLVRQMSSCWMNRGMNGEFACKTAN